MGKVLEITTRIGCSINCHYCPQSLLLREYFKENDSAPTVMSLETFQKCIDKVPSDVMIDFAGMSEPWLNPDCTAMLQYAASKGHKLSVFSTLVGMTEADLDIVESLDIEQFVIHIPDAEEHAHIPVTEEYKALLKRTIQLNIRANKHFSCHGTVHPAIAEYIDSKAIIADEMVDRAGNLDFDDVAHQQLDSRVACLLDGEQLNHNILLPDGRVLLCCMDYGIRHVLGNLLVENYEDITNGSAVCSLRNAMRTGNSDILCTHCTNALSFSELAAEYTMQRDKALQLWDDSRWLYRELASQKKYVTELLEGKAWCEQQMKNLQDALAETQKGAEELNAGKAWLESQLESVKATLEEAQKGATELAAGKAWLEEQVKSKQVYIKELTDSKKKLATQLECAKALAEERERQADNLKNELSKANYKLKQLTENKWIRRIIVWNKIDI